MKCSICKDKGYFVLRTTYYKRLPCRCKQKGGGLATKTGEGERLNPKKARNPLK